MDFQEFVSSNIEQLGADRTVNDLSNQWMIATSRLNYTYNFRWLGLPIIQYPQDIVMLQEIVWQIKPDLILETGIARGGSLALSASLLLMCDYAEAQESANVTPLSRSSRKVIGIDIDIRSHSRNDLGSHPLSGYIEVVEGSSVDPQIVQRVHKCAAEHTKILVLLDSNHTHEHVLAELEAYAPLVSEGSYCIVYDTGIEDMPPASFPDRPWDIGNNPKTAVHEFLRSHPEFVADQSIHQKLQITVAPDGFLKRIGRG